jgi:hypothetical protein
MKRLTWVFAILAVVATVAVITPPAQASCSQPFQFGSAYAPGVTAVYVYAPAPASLNTAGANRLGRFWEPGKRNSPTPGVANNAGQDDGGCDAKVSCGGSFPDWFTRFGTFPWYVNGQMDSGLVDGCPGVPGDGDLSGPDEIIIAIFDRDQAPGPNGGDAYYYVARTFFRGTDAPEFNIKRNTACNWQDFQMKPIPHANVTLSSRVDSNTVSLDFSLADVGGVNGGHQIRDANCAAAAPYSTITGYRICQFEGLADPGRLASAWTCAAGPATGPGGATVNGFQVDCADVTPPIDNDKFIAIQLVYDGGAYLSEYVSKSVRVECDPNIAQPEGRRPLPRRLNQPEPEGKGTRRP